MAVVVIVVLGLLDVRVKVKVAASTREKRQVKTTGSTATSLEIAMMNEKEFPVLDC